MIGETQRKADASDASPMQQSATAVVVDEIAALEETSQASAPANALQITSIPQIPLSREIGGRDGPEPTRFGDWEKNGRCIDF